MMRRVNDQVKFKTQKPETLMDLIAKHFKFMNISKICPVYLIKGYKKRK